MQGKQNFLIVTDGQTASEEEDGDNLKNMQLQYPAVQYDVIGINPVPSEQSGAQRQNMEMLQQHLVGPSGGRIMTLQSKLADLGEPGVKPVQQVLWLPGGCLQALSDCVRYLNSVGSWCLEIVPIAGQKSKSMFGPLPLL